MCRPCWTASGPRAASRRSRRTLPASAQLQERWLPALATLPELVSPEALLGQEALEAAIEPEVLALGRHRGRLLALPLITGSIGMIANTDVLARAGVEAVPTTLDAFRAALIAVRDRVPNAVPFAMATKNANSIPLDTLIWVWAHGGQVINAEGQVRINSAEGRAAVDSMVGMMRDRLIAPEIDRPDSRRLFAQGASAFYIDAPQGRLFIRTFSGRGEAADAFTRPVPTPVLRAGDVPHSVQWGHLVAFFRGGRCAGAGQRRRALGALPDRRCGAIELPDRAVGLARQPHRPRLARRAGRPLLQGLGGGGRHAAAA